MLHIKTEKNKFLNFLVEIENKEIEKELSELEDLDTLSEIIYTNDFSLIDYIKISMNPFYGFTKISSKEMEVFKRGIKSEDWLKKEKYTKIEERLILSSI